MSDFPTEAERQAAEAELLYTQGAQCNRGYNVLSLDTDLHLAVNPLKLLNGVAYAPAPPSDCV